MTTTPWGAFEAALTSTDPGVRFEPLPIAALTGADRARAEGLLLAQLGAGTTDGRVADALAEIGSQQAVPLLRAALPTLPDGAAKVAFGRALGRLTGDDAAGDAVREALSAPAWSDRASAAASLAQFPGAESEAALRHALEDDEAVVRTNAFQSLLALLGVADLLGNHVTPLGLLRVRLFSDARAIRAAALREIDAMIDGLRGGKSAAAVGLTAALTPDARVVSGHFHDEAPYDAAALALLRGYDRHWAIWTLLTTFAQDPRVGPALVAMRASEARDAAAEVLGPASAAALDALRDGSVS